ncbi:MAG: DUF5337 domain-containing protein [Rhodobacteraceae bacterium]|nr:DUF5337 domain-containing protein [Paracoccaceae bacterium]
MSREENQRKQTRLASYVMLGSVLLLLAGSWIGGVLGLPIRFAFLLDFIALGGFAFAIITLFRVWRSRRQDGE